MARPVKVFFMKKEEIRTLAPGRGSCIAGDMITVDGRTVGYMYREQPDNALDSGWRFLSGVESDAYVNNPDNLDLYDVNSIANSSPDIVPLLDAPPGSAFGRDVDPNNPADAGSLVPVPFDPAAD